MRTDPSVAAARSATIASHALYQGETATLLPDRNENGVAIGPHFDGPLELISLLRSRSRG